MQEEMNKRAYCELELMKYSSKVKELRDYMRSLKRLIREEELSIEVTLITEEGSESERTENEDIL
jgi:hypothetical protein